MSWKSVTQPTVWGAKSSRQMRNMRYVQKAIRAGKVATRGVPYLGLSLLAYDAYDYVSSREIPLQITESTPKLPYDLEPYVQTPEYQYQDLTGYEDHGPVHWSRTV